MSARPVRMAGSHAECEPLLLEPQSHGFALAGQGEKQLPSVSWSSTYWPHEVPRPADRAVPEKRPGS
jgi:hypothetical protein